MRVSQKGSKKRWISPDERWGPSKGGIVVWKQLGRVSIIFLTFVVLANVAALAQDPSTPDRVPPKPEIRDNGGGAGDHEQTPVLQHRTRRYQLHSADVLELKFPFTPEFDQSVTIQPDGYITLRGVDSIRVEGQTLPELRSEEHTSELQSRRDLVCRLLLEKKKNKYASILSDRSLSRSVSNGRRPSCRSRSTMFVDSSTAWGVPIHLGLS